MFLSYAKMTHHMYTLMHKNIFFYPLFGTHLFFLLMTVGLAEKQMLAFCLSACVISIICISRVLYPRSSVFIYFVKYFDAQRNCLMLFFALSPLDKEEVKKNKLCFGQVSRYKNNQIVIINNFPIYVLFIPQKVKCA